MAAVTADTQNRLSYALTSDAAAADVVASIAAGGTPTGIVNTQLAAGALLSASPLATRAHGFATGAGGAVTQATNRSTGVTLNTICGAITTDATSLAAGAEATFTVTNSQCAVGDVPVIAARSGQTAATSVPTVSAVAAGSFDITLSNLNGSTADTGAMIINFLIMKAVSA